jgi:hypothetical protein
LSRAAIVPEWISLANFRHAERVSASMFPSAPSVPVARWTLKQVQGGGLFVEAAM